MIMCTQCNGNGGLQNNECMNRDNNAGSTVAFTTLTQVPETICGSCLGTGRMTGAGT